MKSVYRWANASLRKFVGVRVGRPLPARNMSPEKRSLTVSSAEQSNRICFRASHRLGGTIVTNMPRPETFAPSQRSRGRRIFSKWWCCWENSTRHRCRTRRTSIIDKFRKSRYGEMVVLILSFPFRRGARPPFPLRRGARRTVGVPSRPNPAPLPLLPAQSAGRTGVHATVYAGATERNFTPQLRAA